MKIHIAIPAHYVSSILEQFNPEETNRDFNYGREMALNGIQWRTAPPGYAVRKATSPSNTPMARA